MEEGTANITIDRYAKLVKGSWFSQFHNGSNPWMARYVYGLMFLIATFLAWAVRDYGHGALTEMKRLEEFEGGVDCLGTGGVLRVSLGCFLFYFVMFLSTAGTSKLGGARELWHSGWWFAKILLMITLTLLPFFVPSAVIRLYGELAHFGAGVFLLIQLISIISFITWLNDCCQSDKYADRCHFHVMLLATIAYVVCILGVILMYIWYVPEASCLLNIFFITWTLVLLQLMTSVSLHPKGLWGYMWCSSAGVPLEGMVFNFLTFLSYPTNLSLQQHTLFSFSPKPKINYIFVFHSEPPETKCIKKSEGANKQDWLTIISFVVAVLAIVIATFSTGIDSKCFQFRKDESEAEDDVPYGFGFFHFVFATGAMYFAMLLVSWNTNHTVKKWTIDVGWTSTWVRIVNEWLAVCLYIWMLIAPIIWKNRQAAESSV